MQDFKHIFGRQRFEIQAIRRIIIGRHGFRVTVDHDRLITSICQSKACVNAAIVKFDTLPDAVRTTAQDNDFFAIRRRALALRHAKAWRLVGRIHIRRFRLKFGSACVNALEHRSHAEFMP